MSPASSFYARSTHAILATTAMAISIVVQGVASAHPGHGITPDGDTPAHYILEPSHGISTAVILFVTLAATIIIRHCVTTSRNRTSE